jgi:uncharacterized protein
MSLDAYKPRREWYLHDPAGIHGLGHAARVLVWANIVATWMREQGGTVDVEVVRWAATLHDVRRLDDGKDPLHGERAAEWVRANSDTLKPALSEGQLDRLVYCCAWHVPNDDDAPVLTPELIALKDGDGLDRVRLGDLKSDFLRTSRAKSLCASATLLFLLSDRSELSVGWEAVKTAAAELSLWCDAGAMPVSR